MQRPFYILIFIALFCSCSSNAKDDDLPTDDQPKLWRKPPGGIFLWFIDEEQNDLLNPESSDYWGDYFINGIKLFAAKNGEKVMQNHQIIPNAFNLEKDYSLSVIYCEGGDNSMDEEDEMISYNWISYTDGTEDEVRIKWGGELYYRFHKIWINDELVFDLRPASGFNPELPVETYPYFHPKYYSWMTPERELVWLSITVAVLVK